VYTRPPSIAIHSPRRRSRRSSCAAATRTARVNPSPRLVLNSKAAASLMATPARTSQVLSFVRVSRVGIELDDRKSRTNEESMIKDKEETMGRRINVRCRRLDGNDVRRTKNDV